MKESERCSRAKIGEDEAMKRVVDAKVGQNTDEENRKRIHSGLGKLPTTSVGIGISIGLEVSAKCIS